MTDKMSIEQRRHCMSRIKSKDTRPELLVRHFLWHHGYRYRLHRKGLPGRPDIVIGRLKVAIFVNGCFWHGHSCQRHFPETNRNYWHNKIFTNRNRDYKNHSDLEAQGWVVIVIWECELARTEQRKETLGRLLKTLQLLDQHAARPYQLPGTGEEYIPQAAEEQEEYIPLAAEDREEYK